MEDRIYEAMSELEEKHWWFRGRRAIIGTVINRLVPLGHNLDIVDVGSGTGGNLALLSTYGEVYGIEMSERACMICRRKGFSKIYCGKIEDVLPSMSEKKFDLITLIDVLEHLDDDIGILGTLRSALKEEGHILVTVPAHPFLWSSHDLSHHHKRRYKLNELIWKLNAAGLKIEYVSYFNMWLFPIVSLVRAIKCGFGISKDRDDLFLPHPLLNWMLFRVFSSERHFIGKVRLPAGVSIVALVRPTQAGRPTGAAQ